MAITVSVPKHILRPLLHIPATHNHLLRRGGGPLKDKVVVVMGATGTGKSRLSIDLASLFPAEVINSDKIQVYDGLDIATNKITDHERRGIRHHLLGVADPQSDFSAANFKKLASICLKDILGRGRLPIIAGGSNSFLKTLIDMKFRSRYDCCFLWVDVEMPVLNSFISDRVDRMVDRGMVDEIRDFHSPIGDYSKGIRRAIGVPELDEFFRVESFCEEEIRARILAEAIDTVKMNTRRLARRQLEKIQRLRTTGWRIHRLDATEVFRRRGGEAEAAAWENMVAGRGASIVCRFLDEMNCGGRVTDSVAPAVMATAPSC